MSKSTYNPKLEEWSETWSQEIDTCQSSNDIIQTLELSTQDGGGGPYLIIKTERWALDEDDIEEFAHQLKTFISKKKSLQ